MCCTYQLNTANVIIRKFGKLSFLANKPDEIYGNDTGYSDDEIKKVLKPYNDKFKRPLKKYLIEYYRHIYNPQLKMEGTYLDHLGFKSCCHCFDENRH